MSKEHQEIQAGEHLKLSKQKYGKIRNFFALKNKTNQNQLSYAMNKRTNIYCSLPRYNFGRKWMQLGDIQLSQILLH